jgi:hypothetical protein
MGKAFLSPNPNPLAQHRFSPARHPDRSLGFSTQQKAFSGRQAAA